jgi:hypothetical protein
MKGKKKKESKEEWRKEKNKRDRRIMSRTRMMEEYKDEKKKN